MSARRAIDQINKHAGVVLVALAVFGGGLYAYQVNEFSDQANCQADYNQRVSKNIRIRADIAARDTEAKTLLLDSIGNLFLLPPAEDKKEEAKRTAEFLELFRDFKRTMSAVATARAENPVPELTDEACND